MMRTTRTLLSKAHFWERVRHVGEGSVILELDSPRKHVATLRLVNPLRRNALDGKMMYELGQAVEELKNGYENGVALVLRGCNSESVSNAKSNFFCSGMDLSLVKQGHVATSEDAAEMSEYMQSVLWKLRTLPLVSVAAVQGGAVGGGSELMSCPDFRIMHVDSYVYFKQTTLGATPGWGGGKFLTDIVGRSKALRILLRGEPLTAQEAFEIGLVDKVVYPSEKCDRNTTADMDEAITMFLDEIVCGALDTHGHVEALRRAKTVVSVAANPNDYLGNIKDVFNIERSLFAGLWGSERNRNAIKNMK
eukprot:m.38872 g.38872  ORF g.38872 m.38872 type:complete len:306 (+) comp9487_c0_seq2:309-1226(+)